MTDGRSVSDAKITTSSKGHRQYPDRGLAGALPPIAWYAWIEWTVGFHNGFGGLAWLAALGFAALVGGLAAGFLGAAGRGVRVISLGNMALVLLGACSGAMLWAIVGQVAVGIGDEKSVAIVLLSETAGIILGMLLLTAPR